MIDSKTRAKIKRLVREGHSQKAVATLVGVSRRTVNRISREGNGGPPRRPVGRPSKTRPYAPLIRRALAGTPEIASCDLLDLARRAGYDGSRAAFYRMIRAVRSGESS